MPVSTTRTSLRPKQPSYETHGLASEGVASALGKKECLLRQGANSEETANVTRTFTSLLSTLSKLGGLLRMRRARHAGAPRDVAIFFVPVDGALERGFR